MSGADAAAVVADVLIPAEAVLAVVAAAAVSRDRVTTVRAPRWATKERVAAAEAKANMMVCVYVGVVRW